MKTGTRKIKNPYPHLKSSSLQSSRHFVTDKMTPSVANIIQARENTNAKIDEYVNVKLDVIRHIEMLPRRQCEALDLLYVRKRQKRNKGQGWYYTWSEIADEMGCTEQNVGKLRSKALKNLQKILDSEEKTEKVDWSLV